MMPGVMVILTSSLSLVFDNLMGGFLPRGFVRFELMGGLECGFGNLILCDIEMTSLWPCVT